VDPELIIKKDVTELREGLMKGEFTSVQLVKLFAKQIMRVGRKNNYHTEELFQEALDQAEEKDRERRQALREGKQLPFMHGIPISIKEIVRIKNIIVSSTK